MSALYEPSTSLRESSPRFAFDGAGDMIGAVLGFVDSPWGMWIALDLGGPYPRPALAPFDGHRMEADHLVLPWSRATVHFASKLLSAGPDALDLDGIRVLLEYYERAQSSS